MNFKSTIHLNNRNYRTFSRVRRLFSSIAFCFLLVCLIIGATSYSNTRIALATTNSAATARAVIVALEKTTPEQPTATVTTTNFVPFVAVEPSLDGNAVTFSTDSNTLINDQLYANVRSGPTGDKLGWTMIYSDSEKSFIVTVPGFSPAATEEGSVNITTTQGLNSPDIQFNRVFVPANSTQPIRSLDNVLQVDLVNADTFPVATYVAVTTNQSQPGAVPVGHLLLGHSYSLRSAGHIIETDQSMSLNFFSADALLGNADPHSLGIFYWLIDPIDANNSQWVEIKSTLLLDNDSIVAQTKLLGTYALMLKPSWSSDFSTLTSVEQSSIDNLQRAGSAIARQLSLRTTPGVGMARSIPISPTVELQSWGIVTFTGVMSLPETALTVDVVDLDGRKIMTDVQPGASLSQIDVQLHPAIQLQVNMSSSVSNVTPALFTWKVTWQPVQPSVVKIGKITIPLGQSVTVPIRFTQPALPSLRTATIVVTYDPSLINVAACVVVAPELRAGTCNYDRTTGNIHQVRFNLITNASIPSEATVAELTITPIAGQGTTIPLTVDVVLATDAKGNSLPLLTENGEITVTGTPTGDVNCDDQTNLDDVKLITAYDVGLLQVVTSCPLLPNTLLLAQCDLNGDTLCDLRDALLIPLE